MANSISSSLAPHSITTSNSIASSPSTSALPRAPVSPTDRIVRWEVNLARQWLSNFSTVINAHAIVMSLLVTVSFVGFLQPAKGWKNNTQNNNDSSMFSSASVVAFIVFNSLSFYCAVAGLLIYIYCGFSTIIYFGSVPTPERFDDTGKALIFKLRSILRRVALPSVQRKATVLFYFLASSLLCCVAAYISAGLAAVGHSMSVTLAVVLPAIPGCILIVFLVIVAATNMSMVLRFDERLRYFWTAVGVEGPEPEALNDEALNAVDPFPNVLRRLRKVVWRESPLNMLSNGNIGQNHISATPAMDVC